MEMMMMKNLIFLMGEININKMEDKK